MSFKKSTSFSAKANQTISLSYQANIFSFRPLCFVIFTFSAVSFPLFLYWSHGFGPSHSLEQSTEQSHVGEPINLLEFPSAWNHLTFPPNPPRKRLKIALFVKKWPHRSLAGGLERHAMTLHKRLARRGHQVHVFTTSVSPLNSTVNPESGKNLRFHFTKPSPGGYLDQASVWKQFQAEGPFDVAHTESVGLSHTRSRNVSNIVVSWHGIAYETIHSDLIQELLRGPEEPKSKALAERLSKVVEEVKFFPSYAHHVATSDHAGDVLKRIYMIPEERVHVVLNGVDEEIFRPDRSRAENFKVKFRVPKTRMRLVIGMAGRLVKDKGHPLMFQALKQLLTEKNGFKEKVLVLVAGDGPWSSRYKDLGANLIVLGPLDQTQLAGFYNTIDVFVNPTLRAQGLDHTLLEAILCGKAVMATRVASVTGSVIVGSGEMGYTFSPAVDSLKKALLRVVEDGREVLARKGEVARKRGLKLFTATKMAAAYERLFLCMSNTGDSDEDYCHLPSSVDEK